MNFEEAEISLIGVDEVRPVPPIGTGPKVMVLSNVDAKDWLRTFVNDAADYLTASKAYQCNRWDGENGDRLFRDWIFLKWDSDLTPVARAETLTANASMDGIENIELGKRVESIKRFISGDENPEIKALLKRHQNSTFTIVDLSTRVVIFWENETGEGVFLRI